MNNESCNNADINENDRSMIDDKMRQLVDEYGLRACEQSLGKLAAAATTTTTTTAQPQHLQNDGDALVRSTRRSLAKERNLNAAITSISVDAVCTVDIRGRIRTVNRSAVECFGYDDEGELVGQHFDSLFVSRRQNNHQAGDHQPDSSLLIKSFHETGRGGRVQQEVSARKKNGAKFPALLWIRRVVESIPGAPENDDDDDAVEGGESSSQERRENGNNDEEEQKEEGIGEEEEEPAFVVLLRDHSTAMHAQRQRRQSEDMKSAILDATSDAIFVVNRSGTIVSVNRAGIEMFGYARPGDMTNESIEMIVGRGNRAEQKEQFLESFRSETASEGEEEMGNNHHHHGRGSFRGSNTRGSFSNARGSFSNARSSFSSTRSSFSSCDGGGGGSPLLQTRHELQCRRSNWTQFPAIINLHRVGPFLVAFVRDTSEEKKARELEVEVRSAEELLLNVLPEQIVERLKADPSHLADHHANASILFADIVGFTAMSSKMKPLELVTVLNDLFTRFDGLVEEYGLNKVKTIGDCYMVTSIPHRSDGRKACAAICHFAIDMIAALQTFNEEYSGPGIRQQLGLRVGINCGNVVAGVVGTNRFLYDLWGDAVNVASRMESTGTPYKIQVTKAVVDLVPVGEFVFEPRGEVAVKGKGTMETYFLTKPLRKRDRRSVIDSLSEVDLVREVSRRSLFRAFGGKTSRARGLIALIQRSKRGAEELQRFAKQGVSASGALSSVASLSEREAEDLPPLARGMTDGGASVLSSPFRQSLNVAQIKVDASLSLLESDDFCDNNENSFSTPKNFDSLLGSDDDDDDDDSLLNNNEACFRLLASTSGGF